MAKAKTKKVVDPILGDQEGIVVGLNDGKYSVAFSDNNVGNNTFVRVALKEDLPNKDLLQWNKDTKSFEIEAEHRDLLAQAIEKSRHIVSDMKNEISNFEESLKTELMTANPEIKDVKFVPAFTKQGERYNGQIMEIGKFSIAQLSGMKDGIQYVRVHGVDKFLRNAEDWKNPEAAIKSQFPDTDKPMSIVYGEKNKASVDFYKPRANTQSQTQSKTVSKIQEDDIPF